MSREEITKVLVEELKRLTWLTATPQPIAENLVQAIERLLADEREKVVDAATACRKREIQAEREKVREMCAVMADEWGAGDEEEEGRKSIEAWQFLEKYGKQDLAPAIRQLDLAKDLAPSSREEGRE